MSSIRGQPTGSVAQRCSLRVFVNSGNPRSRHDLARLGKSPISAEIVRRIDEVFAIEREINDASVDMRLAARQERSKPLVADLKAFMHASGK